MGSRLSPEPGPSPIEELAERLMATTALSGKGITVTTASKASKKPPPRIVLYPVTGKGKTPTNVRACLLDATITVGADIWAHADDVWAVFELLVQALDEQAGGTYGAEPAETSDDDPGFWWGRDDVSLEFDQTDDTSLQGAALTVTFPIQATVERPAGGVGLVESYSLTRSP